MLLADDSDTVKQHYYPWVPELQDLLEKKEVKRSWDEDAPIILAEVDRALQGADGTSLRGALSCDLTKSGNVLLQKGVNAG